MSKPFHTPLMDFLDQQQVNYRLLRQKHETITIEDTAQARGIDSQQMVKSILLRDMSDRYALACVPGDQSVDPKKVRALLGWRRMTCVDHSQLEAITGYQLGCVAPLRLKQPMPIILDKRLKSQQVVSISSGKRLAGLAIELADLVRLCSPSCGDICRD